MSDLCYGWPVYNRIFRQAELMDRMMEHVGANQSVAVRLENGMAWYEARTRCIDGAHERQCRNWLELGSNASRAKPDFCPNARFFQSCQGTRN